MMKWIPPGTNATVMIGLKERTVKVSLKEIVKMKTPCYRGRYVGNSCRLGFYYNILKPCKFLSTRPAKRDKSPQCLCHKVQNCLQILKL